MQNKSFHIIILITITFLINLNTFQNDFTNWDDQELIINNEKIKSLSVRNILDIFASPTGADYLPLKEISYSIDYRIWKLNPFGYHLANVILYAGNVILVYLIINFLFKDSVAAIIASIYFSVHPVHVESVAWLSARKDVLSGFFFFLSFYLYIKITSVKNTKIIYLASLLSFALACLSKPVAIVLPAVVLLYELSFSHQKKFLKIINKSIPYIIISLFASYLTLKVGMEYGTVKSRSDFSFIKTIISFSGVMFEYIKKIIFPINLSALYEPHSRVSLLSFAFIFSSALVIFGILFLLWLYRERKIIFFSIAWFPLTLLPVSGIILLSIERADRYLFIPLFGVSVLVAVCFDESGFQGVFAKSKIKNQKSKNKVIFLLISALLSVLTIQRNTVWKDSFTLWSDVVKKSPPIASAHNNLGNVFRENNQIKEAIDEYKKAVELDTEHPKANYNLATVYQEQEKLDEAIYHYKKAIKAKPDLESAYNNLGNIFIKKGDYEEALKMYKEAVKLSPDYFLANINLGVFYYEKGQLQESLKYFEKAILIEPKSSDAWYFAGLSYEKTGLKEEADRAFLKAYKLNPQYKYSADRIKKKDPLYFQNP